MARILFSHSYFYRFDPKQWRNQMPYPPLATIGVAAWMRENQHEVSLFDTALAEGPEPLQEYLERDQPQYLVLYDDGFNYLTKMCLTNMREAAFKMTAMAKAHGCQVIVSSSDSTDHFEKYLEAGADFVMLGEADQTLLDLVAALEDGQSGKDLPGLAFLSDEGVVKTPKRPIMRDLDSLPLPAWDLIDIDAYRNIWMASQGYFSLNIATTRGCPFKCNWCAKPIYGNRYNSRQPEKVAEEIELLVGLGAQHFWMCDDIFGLKPGWVQSFRDALRERKLSIRYKIQSRVDLLLKEDTIDALADSGLEEVWVGAESGSQKILDAMDKGTQLEQIYEATKLLKSKRVRVAFFLQFGYLGETKEDIKKTIRMVTDLVPDDIGVSVSYPLPGTKFYDIVKADLDKKSNWTDSDDLDMMFRGTYGSAYYKKLHRYVHKVYRKRQGAYHFGRLFREPGRVTAADWRLIFAIGYYLPLSWVDGIALKRLESSANS